MKWAQKVQPYDDGPFREQYRGGTNLLEEAHPLWEASAARKTRSRRLATVLSVLTVVLAAAAGITVLPPGIYRWVSAVIAFCAAVIAGLNGVLNPEEKAGKAQTKVVLWEQLRDDVEAYLRRVATLPQTASTAEVEGELARLQQRRDNIKLMS